MWRGSAAGGARPAVEHGAAEQQSGAGRYRVADHVGAGVGEMRAGLRTRTGLRGRGLRPALVARVVRAARCRGLPRRRVTRLAWVARVTGLTRVAGLAGVARLTRVARLAGMARVTGVSRVARLTRVTRVTRVTGVTGVTGVPRVARVPRVV